MEALYLDQETLNLQFSGARDLAHDFTHVVETDGDTSPGRGIILSKVEEDSASGSKTPRLVVIVKNEYNVVSAGFQPDPLMAIVNGGGAWAIVLKASPIITPDIMASCGFEF